MSTFLLSSDTPEGALDAITDPSHYRSHYRSHYGWFQATMWLLGIELRTSGRAASALNC